MAALFPETWAVHLRKAIFAIGHLNAMGHFLDLNTWKRREHFALFRDFPLPFFSVTVEVDATSLWLQCRAGAEAPFFLAGVFLLLRSVNETEAMRLRIRDGRVWLHDQVSLSTTILRPDETFGFARLELASTFEDFRNESQPEIDLARSSQTFEPSLGQDNLVYHSTLPWFRFTSFTNALSLRDSIPRIVFGKCEQVGRKRRMPVAIEVHHALVDGLDVGRLLERFQTELSEFRL